MIVRSWRIGSVRQTLLWFHEHGLELPCVTPRGEVRWKRPIYGTLYQLLTNPAYGGAYAYGKSENATRYEAGVERTNARRKPREQWLAFIPGTHEGYVEWERFECIQRAIRGNLHVASRSLAAAREGQALIAGLLRCRRCASKLTVHYTGQQHDVARYACHRAWLDKAQPRCISFGGSRVDAAIVAAVLSVVQPAAIEAAIMAYQEQTSRQDEVRSALERDLEAARYAASRAQRQYDAADPQNRLVADELERRWNQALARVREIEQRLAEHDGVKRSQPRPSLADFTALAERLEALWEHPDTEQRLKKRIVRSLIHEIVVDLDAAASEVVLVIHWIGGVHTEVRVPRRRRGQNSSHTAPETIDAVRALARICSDAMIANVLNRNGRRTGRGNFWTCERVTALRSHHAIPVCSDERRAAEGWLNLTEAAKLVGVSARTLRLAVEHGELQAEHPLADGPWIFRRDQLTTDAARAIAMRAARRSKRPAVPTENQTTLDLSMT